MIYIEPLSFRSNDILMRELAAAFPYEKSTYTNPDGCSSAIIGTGPVTEEFLRHNPYLKIISKYGVGLDNIDMGACKRHWVRVLHIPGVNAAFVAEHTIGLMLALKRNILMGHSWMESGVWRKDGGESIDGSTIGIIGHGHVGQKVRDYLFSFHPNFIINDIGEWGSWKTKEEVLRNSDILTLHVPLTDQTKYMINEETLSWMKPTAVIINTSRGLVIDQKALKKALKSGKLAGAALDVFENEPEIDQELVNMPNVICTPHIAGNSRQSVLAMGRAAIANLKKALE